MSFFIHFIGFYFFNILVLHAAPEKYAAIVVDGETGRILHGVNETAPRFPASLAKKMTLYLIFEALKNRKITLQTMFTVSARAAMQGPSKLGIGQGETISVENIIKSLVIKSANDISVVAAEGLSGTVENFAKKMTNKALELGMQNTVFKNASGVNDECTTDRRQYTTARDLSILGISLYRDFPEYTYYFKLKNFRYRGKNITSHNHMLGNITGLDGIKTGFANAPGFNISTSALRYDSKNRPHRLFVVVMGGRTWRSRDRHAEELIEHGFKMLNCPSSYDEFQQKSLDQIDPIIEHIKYSKPSHKIQKNKKSRPIKIMPEVDSISQILKNAKKNQIKKINYKVFKTKKKNNKKK